MTIDKELFLSWARRYHAALYRHAYWMTGQADVAADVVQETYYRAWKARANLQNLDNPLPWLITILRRATYQELSQIQGRAETFPASEWLEAVAAPPEERDGLIDLSRALQRLNPQQRDLLLLYGLHGFTYAQISVQFDIPLGTVMSRLARAREALQEALEHSYDALNVIPFRSKRTEHL